MEAFPVNEAPAYLMATAAKGFDSEVAWSMRIDQVPIAPRSTRQNLYYERVIGTIRRKCQDHAIVIAKRHLKRILSAYFDYNSDSRTHLSLVAALQYPMKSSRAICRCRRMLFDVQSFRLRSDRG